MIDRLTIRDIPLKGKNVFLRVDFNVPQNEKGEITDDTRIREALPTIQYIVENKANIVCASHLGRPKGFDLRFSMRPVSKRFEEISGLKTKQMDDCIGDRIEAEKSNFKEGEIIFLENIRFYKEETENNPDFARKLAEKIDIFVNDAFSASHRTHASVVGIASFVPLSVAGFLMEKEIKYLGMIIANPERPFIAIVGGAKVSDKITILKSLIEKADKILIGGAMAYTFLKAMDEDVGKSLVEIESLETAKNLMEEAKRRGIELLLPSDHVVSENIEGKSIKVLKTPIPKDFAGFDIGDETIEIFSNIIKEARTIFWNGPVGVFEREVFSKGTFKIARAVAKSKAVSVVGGGDSALAVKMAEVEKDITHISTGGGASLEFISKGTLPGIEVLTKK
ncbi:MAG: phosphoglycerate kinase [Candidatus Aminicenantia bacterium]